jgi:hypothetical protein
VKEKEMQKERLDVTKNKTRRNKDPNVEGSFQKKKKKKRREKNFYTG